MNFDEKMVFSAVNAEELKPGDKVIVADTMAELKMYVEQNVGALEIERIEPENYIGRFTTHDTNIWRVHFPLAYLVERKENCCRCGHAMCSLAGTKEKDKKVKTCEYYEPKNKYRPFQDTNELIDCWYEKKFPSCPGFARFSSVLTAPSIWVRKKNCTAMSDFITSYDGGGVRVCNEYKTFVELFDGYEFLDGSPCGVEVK